MNTLERRVGKTAQPFHWDMKRPPADYPLLEPGPSTGLATYYFDWLDHPDYDGYWKQWSIEQHFAQIKIPALHVAAWYDLFQDGSLKNYMGIKSLGGNETARKGQRLMVIVGGHAGAGPKIGAVDFGKDSVLDTGALGLRWYDYLLKGADNGMASQKPVRLFVMGKNVWRDEEDWPLARAKAANWSTSNVFLAGHKLRLEVCSSNFPRFDRNLNTTGNPEKDSRMVKATNVVYHDRDHPSALILPMVP
jgi:hypothetical protein